MRRDTGADVDDRRGQIERAAIGEREIALDRDLAAGADLEAAEPVAAETLLVEPGGVGAAGWRGIVRAHARRDVGNRPDPHIGIEQIDPAKRGVLPERQRAGE